MLHAGTGLVVEPWANVGRDLPDACLRVKVPRVTCNDLRRTFASWSVQAGTPAKVIANMMGHTSTRMVDLVYGRVGPTDYVPAMARCHWWRPQFVHTNETQSHAGYTDNGQTRGTDGTGGNAVIVHSSSEVVVPRVGIEPTTRGFSVRCSTN